MIKEKKLHVVFLIGRASSGAGFPFGGSASASRVKNLALGLKEAGAEVTVLNFISTDTSPDADKLDAKGVYRGINYEFTSGSVRLSQDKKKRAIQDTLGLANAMKRLFELKIKEKLDSVYLFAGGAKILLPIYILSRSFKIPILYELCEWPPASTNKSEIENLFFYRFELTKVDGVISISNYLADKVSENNKRYSLNVPCLKIPILLDPEEWKMKEAAEPYPYPYLLWCGSVDGYDYAVEFLIRILYEIHKTNKAIKLKIIGKVEGNTVTRYRKLMTELALMPDDIEFTGFVSQQELKELYANALALLIPIFNTERDIARFPTKIGEYLLAGRPVVSSSIGEFSNYATHEVNALLCETENPIDFAITISKLYKNPELANKIGSAGRELALSSFSYRIHGKSLYIFLYDALAART